MDVAVLESDAVDAASRVALCRLWDRAFGDRFDDDDIDHAFGGVHVLVWQGADLIGHASAVPRMIRFGDQPWRTVGYVEGVATDPEHQHQGVGTRVMTRLHDEIGTRPESRYGMKSLVPLYGRCSRSTAVIDLKSSTARWSDEPFPPEAYCS